jgi:hypothetical protein
MMSVTALLATVDHNGARIGRIFRSRTRYGTTVIVILFDFTTWSWDPSALEFR